MLTRIRDLVSEPLTLDYFQQRQNEGWILAAVEWVRESAGPIQPPSPERSEAQEIPYGYRISDDCSHLIRHSHEMEAVETIFEKVVAGWRPTEIAAELNERGFRTRQQSYWTPAAVFDLLPRLIELSPKLLKRPEWPDRRRTLEIIA